MHIHKYEKLWLIFGVGSLILFLVILAIGAFYKGIHPPSHMDTIDPKNVQEHESFKEENLGLRQVGENEYIVNVLSSGFYYDLGKDENDKAVNTIRIPVGAKVLFQTTSTDVVHGFQIAGTNVNMMVEPGHISTLETVMQKPGTYTLLCNEYCGSGHHYMAATVEVFEP